MEIIQENSKDTRKNGLKKDSYEMIRHKGIEKTKTQCHFISNTHWDREWRFSMQRTRHMLVYLMDMLLDIFEKEPDFKSFHLDSQTIPLQDYLEIRPEKKETVKKLIKEKKLLVGPWFCLPDEFSLSGESLIRNLLLGHKIAKDMGYVSKTGYSPFGWGQISQMPQIYKGFGINFSAFYRGVSTDAAPNSEYIWEGADGTQIIASRLAMRPRFNVWYVIQRPAYWQQEDENNRIMPWSCGSGPFKFVGERYREFDAQYARPKFKYDPTVIPARAKQAMEEQDGDWTTKHRFWSCGHDSSCPDIREVQMIKDCNKALKGDAEVFHSTFEEFQKQVLANVSDDLPVSKGEMRYYSDSKVTSPLFGWILSARMDVKIDNFKTERELMQYAEPLAVYSAMLGSEYPQGFLKTAYNWLLQNHGHDSIGGCSRGVISDDMLFRTRQSREISGCVAERALLDIAGTIDYSGHEDEQIALLAYNPAPFKRDEVVSVNLEIPRDTESGSFEIVDEQGQKPELQMLGSDDDSFQIVQSPNDAANMFLTKQYRAKVELKDIPPSGYKTFFVRPIHKEDAVPPRSATMLTGINTMENEYLRVTIQGNGTMTITDKQTGKVFERMGYFCDTAEVGDPWQHQDVEQKQDFTTINEKATVSVIRDGNLEAAFKVAIDWELPACRTPDDKARSEVMKTVRIENIVTLRKGQKWVDVITNIDNTVEDHYLQVAFPSGINADSAFAQGQFDVIERPVKLSYSEDYREPPQSEQPMNSFVDITDGKNGLALLNEGMKAYEATDQEQPELRLTLLRSFPLRICVTTEMTDYSQIDKSSQCLGKHAFHYAVMPHKGDWQEAGIWNAAEKFNLPVVLGQTAPVENGTEPMQKSFLEISDERIAVSAVKQSENGKGWVVRLFNPASSTVKTKIRLNGGQANSANTSSPVERLKKEMALPGTSSQPWKSAGIVNLEELPEKDLELDSQGWCSLSLDPKKIMTVEFCTK